MGGEKLKSSRPNSGIFSVILITAVIFFGVLFPLSAQTAQPSSAEGIAADGNSAENPGEGQSGPVSPVDESAIILGEAAEIPAPSGSSSILVVLRMVLVLALAALAIYGVVFFIKRLAKPQERQDPNLKVLARVPLGNDSFAAVISAGAKAWLVGGGSGGVHLISEIDDNEVLETMLLDDARKTAETANRRFPDFRSLISRLGGSSREAGPELSGNSHVEELRKQRERLKGL